MAGGPLNINAGQLLRQGNTTFLNANLDKQELGLDDSITPNVLTYKLPSGTLITFGVSGLDGADGNVWFTGVGAPIVLSTENDGDLYLDTNNGDVFRFQSLIWTGPIMNIEGPQGPAGTPGSQWFTATGDPNGSFSSGNPGDFYLDDGNGDVYEKVANPTNWGSPVANILGPVGPAGPAGTGTMQTTYTAGTPGVIDIITDVNRQEVEFSVGNDVGQFNTDPVLSILDQTPTVNFSVTGEAAFLFNTLGRIGSDLTGGNARGLNSFDFQFIRSSPSQVASGISSAICSSFDSTVSGNFSSVYSSENSMVTLDRSSAIATVDSLITGSGFAHLIFASDNVQVINATGASSAGIGFSRNSRLDNDSSRSAILASNGLSLGLTVIDSSSESVIIGSNDSSILAGSSRSGIYSSDQGTTGGISTFLLGTLSSAVTSVDHSGVIASNGGVISGTLSFNTIISSISGAVTGATTTQATAISTTNAVLSGAVRSVIIANDNTFYTGATNSAVLGGSNHNITAAITGSVLLGGQSNTLSGTTLSRIIVLGGVSNSIGGEDVVVAGMSNTVNDDVRFSFIFGESSTATPTAPTTHLYSFGESLDAGAGDNSHQFIVGKFNVNQTDSLFEVGNGLTSISRANAFRVTEAGDVEVAGKLTVGGLIDPTGLVLDEQTVSPFAFIATKGTVWVRDDAPNTLIFTDDVGTDFVIGGSIGVGDNFQQVYGNSGGTPGFSTDDAGGPFFIRRNTTGSDADIIFEGRNNASTATFSLAGDGLVSARQFTASESVLIDRVGTNGLLTIGSDLITGEVGRLEFLGHNITPVDTTVVRMRSFIDTNTAGAEDGRLVIDVIVNGTPTPKITADMTAVTINGVAISAANDITGVNSLNISGVAGNTLIVDTQALVVDATNDRVGIGTATPEVRLHIQESAVTSMIAAPNATLIIERGGGTNVLEIASDAAETGCISFGTGTSKGRGKILYNNSTDVLEISVGSSALDIFIDGIAEGVGINEPSPASILHITDIDAFTGAGAGLTIEHNTTGDADLHIVTSAETWTLGADFSDSSNLKISRNADVGTDTSLTFTTSLIQFFSDITIDNIGQILDFSLIASDATSTVQDVATFASSDITRTTVIIRNEVGADTEVRHQTGATINWSTGNDVSQGNAYVITPNTIAATTEVFRLTQAGILDLVNDIFIDKVGSFPILHLGSDLTTDVGRIEFFGHNLTPIDFIVAEINGRILLATPGAEEGELKFIVTDSGIPTQKFSINSTRVTANDILQIQGGFGQTVLSPTMFGLELNASSMDTTNQFTSAIKFTSTDSNFGTENPKLLGVIVGRATETYSADTSGGMALDFYSTPNTPGATNIPLLAMSLSEDQFMNLSIGTSVNEISTNDTLSEDSDDILPTQRAVRQFVLNTGGTGNVSTTSDFITNNALVTVDTAGGTNFIQQNGNVILDSAGNMLGLEDLQMGGGLVQATQSFASASHEMRSDTSVGTVAAITFSGEDSASALAEYLRLRGDIVSNIAGAEEGAFVVQVAAASASGALTTQMTLTSTNLTLVPGLIVNTDLLVADTATSRVSVGVATAASTLHINQATAGSGLTVGITVQNTDVAGSAAIHYIKGAGGQFTAGASTTPDEFIISPGTTLNGASGLHITSAGSFGLGNTGVDVNTILDEDDFVSDSATALSTQQSIRAFVESRASLLKAFSITVNAPQVGDSFTILRVPVDITIISINGLRSFGASTVTVTATHATDRNDATPDDLGTEGINSGTTGITYSPLTNTSISAGEFVWIVVDAIAGTPPPEVTLTFEFELA